jgi:hypothetical protein
LRKSTTPPKPNRWPTHFVATSNTGNSTGTTGLSTASNYTAADQPASVAEKCGRFRKEISGREAADTGTDSGGQPYFFGLGRGT